MASCPCHWAVVGVTHGGFRFKLGGSRTTGSPRTDGTDQPKCPSYCNYFVILRDASPKSVPNELIADHYPSSSLHIELWIAVKLGTLTTMQSATARTRSTQHLEAMAFLVERGGFTDVISTRESCAAATFPESRVILVTINSAS